MEQNIDDIMNKKKLNLEEKLELNGRNKILENQIESMLDDIINDKDEEDINLKFCDNDNLSIDSNNNTLLNIVDNNDDNDMNSFLIFNNLEQNEEFDFKIFNTRNYKKHSTTNNNNNYLKDFSKPEINNFNSNFSFYQNNNNLFPNYFNYNSILRDDQRRKTFESNNSINSNNTNNTYYNSNNSISSFSTINSNRNNSINQNNYYMPNIISLPKLNSNNLKRSPFLNNSNHFNINDYHKRFSTTLIPQGINIQIELLIYELNSILSKNEKLEYHTYINKIKGNVTNILKTHKGSKVFQNHIKSFSAEIIHQIFIEICPSLIDIIIDPYANYFIKKFYSQLSDKDKLNFLLVISEYFIKLSTNFIRTYPIQNIIEQISTKNEKTIIINSIKDYLIELCYDNFGTHILEKIIICFESEYTNFIFDFVIKNFILLSYHINGICIVKKIMSLTNKKEYHLKIQKIIYDNSINLIQHQFGNYVIQTLIETWEMKEILYICSNYKNKFTFLSMLKYSSNVVERLIEKNEIILKDYINEVCENGTISEIMKNNYGNYVIQKALKISVNDDKKKLIEEVNKNIFKINDKKLILKWKRIIANYCKLNDNII